MTYADEVAPGDALDEVFAAPLEEFVAARRRAVQELKRQGDEERAAEAAALRKPTVVVWTVNQLARTEKQQLAWLIKAADRLRTYQTSGNLARFNEAQGELREALSALRSSAERLLQESGRSAGDAVLARISEHLRAAVGDSRSRDALQAGRLTEETDASGFEGLVPVGGRRPARTQTAKKPTKAERAAAARERARREKRAALEEELRSAKTEVARAARELERAERAVERLQSALERAR